MIVSLSMELLPEFALAMPDYTIVQLAKLLKVSRRTIERAMIKGVIKSTPSFQ